MYQQGNISCKENNQKKVEIEILKNEKVDENEKLYHYEMKLKAKECKPTKLSFGYKYNGLLFSVRISTIEYPLIHSCLLADIGDKRNHLEIKQKNESKALEFNKINLKDVNNPNIARGYDRVIVSEGDFIVPQIDGSQAINIKLKLSGGWNIITVKFNVYYRIIYFDLE